MTRPLLLVCTQVTTVRGQTPKYPPLSEYMMPRDAEIALAKSAAPDNISGPATVKVLTSSGFQVVHEGDNGFVCMVMRGWTGAPTFSPASLRGLVYDSKDRADLSRPPGFADRTAVLRTANQTRHGGQDARPDCRRRSGPQV